MFIGRNTDYMKVHLLKSESHSGQALQDFGRQVGIPEQSRQIMPRRKQAMIGQNGVGLTE